MSHNGLLMTVLMLLLLVSALAVIVSKYRSRLLFSEIQSMEKELDQYEIDWGRSQLELTMLTEENRIEGIARKRFGMVMPERDKIVYLKP